jgi:hypothetical protein
MKPLSGSAGAFAALFAMTLFFSAAAQAVIYEGGVTHEEMRKLLIEAGLQAVTVDTQPSDKGEVPELVVMGGPTRWHVQFMACEKDRCADLRLSVGFDITTAFASAIVTEMNETMLGWISGNVYIDEEGDPILQADVNTDGVTGNNIEYSVKVFDAMARCMTVKVGFDDSAAACADLPRRFSGYADQVIAGDDSSQVVFALALDDLRRILRNSGFDPMEGTADSGMVSLRVQKDGIVWTAAIPQSTAEQINGSLMLLTACTTCSSEGGRRANAYNSERRWLTAAQQEGVVVGTMMIPLSGGVTESSIGMMIRSFHGWAVKFESEMPK